MFGKTASARQRLVQQAIAAARESESSKSSGDDLQRRLRRIASMKRTKETAAPEGSLLRVNNIKVLFDGFKALDIDSLELNPFELRVIIGPNGAGKTTLCDVISGKTRPTEGRVTFANADITGMSEPQIARAAWAVNSRHPPYSIASPSSRTWSWPCPTARNCSAVS